MNGVPRRIAMVAACPFPANYGSPAAIRELSETLAEMGHDIHVVTYPYGEDLPLGPAKLHRIKHGDSKRGTHVGPSREKPWLDFLVLVELCRVIHREKIEIIHAHNYEGGLVGVAAKFLTWRPLIYNSVNLMADELHTYGFIKPAFLANWIARALDWFVPIFPDHIIAVTQELYNWMIRRGVPARKLTMVPCGIKSEMFAGADPEKFRTVYPISTRPLVMYAGINSAFQRVDYLLRAFTVVLKEEPTALCMVLSPITGEPDLAANQALARELGIAGSVIFAGPHTLDDLPHYLSMATVTVVSRPDCPGHPIKLLNYMMSAKPTVCFAGAAKGVRHMHDAWIVPDHDWQQMGAGIVALLRDPELRRKLGENARETAVQNFEWRSLCKKVEGIYDGLLGG
jgi:1,2-diacylglycerol 3-alpha-glucosyltransferase